VGKLLLELEGDLLYITGRAFTLIEGNSSQCNLLNLLRNHKDVLLELQHAREGIAGKPRETEFL